MLKDSAIVFLGGGAGCVLRYFVSLAAYRLAGPGFPWGTLAVNLAGCVSIGLIAGLASRHGAPSQDGLPTPFAGLDHSVRLLLVTGLLGGFTTFSAFSIETVDLLRLAQPARAATYVLASVLLGLTLAWVGWRLGMRLAPAGATP